MSTTFSFNTTPEGGDWGWGTSIQKSVQIHPTVGFLPCQNLTKLCDFHYPISGLAGLALQSQNMMSAATQENAFGLCVTQSVLLNGGIS